jgi:hypothetical protein
MEKRKPHLQEVTLPRVESKLHCVLATISHASDHGNGLSNYWWGLEEILKDCIKELRDQYDAYWDDCNPKETNHA